MYKRDWLIRSGGSLTEKIPYSELRSILKTGDLVLFSGKGLFSWIIKKASGKFSHVGIVVKIKDPNVILLLESNKAEIEGFYKKGKTKGVAFTQLSDRVSAYEGEVCVRLIDGKASKLEAAINNARENYVNIPYEAKFRHFVLPMFKHREKCEDDETSFFCSELSSAVLQEAGILRKTKPPQHFSPTDLSSGLDLEDGFSYSDTIRIT